METQLTLQQKEQQQKAKQALQEPVLITLRAHIADRTLKLRHKIVKVIAPELYKESKWRSEFLGGTPRPMICFVNDVYGGKPLIGVEIGVAEGLNAQSILETLQMEKLYLVDPYTAFVMNGKLYKGHVRRFSEAKQRLSRFADRIKFIRKTSVKAASDIPDNLDFVYIDGNHSYDFVKEDIRLYYPKVKVGGVLGGHDFINVNFTGVNKAVREFTDQNDLKLYSERADWWIKKGDFGSIDFVFENPKAS